MKWSVIAIALKRWVFGTLQAKMIDGEDIHDGGIPDGKIRIEGLSRGAKLLTPGFHLYSEVYHEQG